MALFRRFFYKKPPESLLEISERVYVFDCCLSTDVLDEDEYKAYMGGIVTQLQDYYPDASFMVFNFKEGERRNQLSDVLSEYDITVMDYPWQCEGCPLLPMVMIHNFLRSSESWLSLEGQQNVLLMHCERGGWPVLAFMLAGLLLYRKNYTGEQKTLEMVYKQAPRELLHLISPLYPQPSQLRYLQYIDGRNIGSNWPPSDTPLALNCIILRTLPLYDGARGCRPIVRVYGLGSSKTASRSSKLLHSYSNLEKHIRLYRQEECELVKIDIHCRVQGDVVLECIHLEDDLVREEMIFRVIFHTAFVRSNILMLNRDNVDVLWDVKNQLSSEFRAEVLFSDPSVITRDAESEDGNEAEFASPKEFFNVDLNDEAHPEAGLNDDLYHDTFEDCEGSHRRGQDFPTGGKAKPQLVIATSQSTVTEDGMGLGRPKYASSPSQEAYPPTGDLSPDISSLRHDSDGTGKIVVVGFGRDLMEIKTQLAYDSPNLETVPIVGMGGIGKTTLARQVFDDSYIISHFDIRAWVTVSQEYSLRQVLLGLLDSAEILTENMYEMSEAKLVVYLYKGLKDRRYLMVLDDMWDTKIWDSVNIAFPEDSNGSRVLLTTRISDVALYANSSGPLHRMGFLSHDDSWNLLRNKVFGEKDCPHELEET